MLPASSPVTFVQQGKGFSCEGESNMDPESNLAEQRDLVKKINHLWDTDPDNATELAWRAMRLAELVEALDGWLCRGGYFPSEWHSRQRVSA